ncbi:MAG: orotidine-5'-phosphate decarboxylase [Methyloceanibacter sp.]
MTGGRQRLIVALDVGRVEEARALIVELGDSVGVYKIGLELLVAGGFALASELAAESHAVFIDAKLLDIEATVERATAAIAKTGAHFLTVHALDRKTLDAAVRGRGTNGMKLLGVTVLTNLGSADLVQQGIDQTAPELVLRRATLAQDAGFDGVIASAQEAPAIRKKAGAGFLIVTPGIRPKGFEANDQARTMTPAEAIAAGADYLVIGRPITRAADPRAAAQAVAGEIARALPRRGRASYRRG